MKNYIVILLCIAILKGIAQPAVNDTVPDFTVVDVHGNTHHLYSYLEEGKYVCIDFFGTTCDQCQEMVPILSETYQSFGCNDSDVVVLAIDLLHYDGQVLAFEEEYGGIYPAVSGKNGGGEQVYNEWQIAYWPQLVLVNPNKVLISNMNPITQTIIDSVFMNNNISKDSCYATGIENPTLSKENISIFPNPVSDIVHIDFAFMPSSKMNYRLYNTTGRVLLSGFCEAPFSLDLSAFHNGIYLIEILDNLNSYSQKILIN